MRILHVSSLYPPVMLGGAEKVASMLAETQAELGHDVFACSLTPEPTAPGQLRGVKTRPVAGRNPLWIQNSSNYPAPLRLLNKAATVYNFVTASQFAQVLDEIRPDVVHTHSLVEWPPSIWEKAARRGIAIVHTLHDYDLLCIRAALFKDGQPCTVRHAPCRLLSARKRAFHDRINLVAAVSQTVLDTHVRHDLFSHLPPDRMRVQWNPVDLPTARRSRAPRAPSDPIRFGYLGRLVDEKGVGTLIDAARLLPPAGWTLTLAGEGRDREAFEARAAGLPVRFVGRVDPMPFLAEVDVLVSVPQWDEPFGLTTLEAYAAGCRVIGSERGFIGETLAQIDPECRVPPGDATKLAQRMQIEMGVNRDFSPNSASMDALFSQLQRGTVAKNYISAYQDAMTSLS